MKSGINQSDRFLPELEPNYVLPDERSFLELVQFTLHYSESIQYYSLQNHPVSSWKPFLLHDPIFIIGLIASTNLESYKQKHDDLISRLENPENESKDELNSRLGTNLLTMLKNISYWEELFTQSNYQGSLVKELVNSQLYLQPFILEVIPFQKLFDLKDFNLHRAEVSSSGSSPNFSELFKSAYKNIVFFVDLAKRKFDSELWLSSHHQPHVALILSALKLFQEIQKDLNSLTGKHLDYYYQKILQQYPVIQKPVRALVGFSPKPGVERLAAGSGFEFVFESKKSVKLENLFGVELTTARISEVRTLYKSTYYPFSSGHHQEDIALNMTYDSLLYEGEGVSQLVFSQLASVGLPLVMGEDQSQKGGGQKTMVTSLIGLVISSSVLLIEEGRQSIQITLGMSADSFQRFTGILSGLQQQKERAMGLVHEHSSGETKGFIQGFLNEAFQVFVTGRSGWEILDYVYFGFDEKESQLIVTLEPEGPEEVPVPFDPILHGGFDGTVWPCVKFVLNNSAHLPPLLPLQELEVVEIEIETFTSAVSLGVESSNQFGKLDMATPFMPFGPLPAIGSYLKLYNSKFLNRYLSYLSIQLTWAGLPNVRNGFNTYYRGYPGEFSNTRFKAKIEVDSPRKKQTGLAGSSVQETLLFDTMVKSDGEYLVPEKKIDINLQLIDLSLLRDPHPSNEASGEDFSLSLRLSAPDGAFGHSEYTQLYTDISMYNSRFHRKKQELPNPAYTPVLERIEISYKNYTKENLSRRAGDSQASVKLFHLYPFGYSQVFPASVDSFYYLLPQLNRKGNLLIGLTGLETSQFLNLGFELQPAFFIHTVTMPPKVTWEYLEKNRWLPLGNLLMEDSTEGLLHSGIVKIKLPASLYLSNTRLSAGKFWLRVSNSGSTDINSRLKNIFVNAAWVIQRDGQELGNENLGKVSSILYSGALNLNNVMGPFALKLPPSRKTKEVDRTRISELLRHRGRGVTTWDIERLVLDQFPEIGRVMVYGRSDYPEKLVKRSNVQVVVIPKLSGDSTAGHLGLMAPFGLLQEIKTYLAAYIPTFSRLEVCNPVFEKLKVRAAVKFRQEEQSGYYRDMLEKELIGFLAPNPGDLQETKGFINAIYKTEIQNFLESRPYVEFVTRLSVLQIIEVQGTYKVIDTATSEYKIELLRTISPYAILTSAENHHLEIIRDTVPKDPLTSSIGDLSIDSDFVIR